VLELAFGELLFGVTAGVLEAVFPVGVVLGDGDKGAIVASPALPLVLRDVDGDAIEVGREQGFAAKGGQGTIEPEEYL